MALEDELDNLRLIALFGVFETDALRALSFSAETKLLRAGDLLFRKGDASDGGYILGSGSIALEADDHAPAPKKIVLPWALIGETALIASTIRPITAKAREPSTVLRISRAMFEELLERHPLTAARVRQLFKRRVLEFAHELTTDSRA
jgi:CRP-like cAMP-binding protein